MYGCCTPLGVLRKGLARITPFFILASMGAASLAQADAPEIIRERAKQSGSQGYQAPVLQARARAQQTAPAGSAR